MKIISFQILQMQTTLTPLHHDVMKEESKENKKQS